MTYLPGEEYGTSVRAVNRTWQWGPKTASVVLLVPCRLQVIQGIEVVDAVKAVGTPAGTVTAKVLIADSGELPVAAA